MTNKKKPASGWEETPEQLAARIKWWKELIRKWFEDRPDANWPKPK